MHHDPWQVFTEDGKPVERVGRIPEDFLDGSAVCGASHVWMWRHGEKGNVEILLQERSPDHLSYPGFLDISAAGHIDLGETPEDTAVRESKEEINVEVSREKLELIFEHKKDIPNLSDVSIKLDELQWVYLLELDTQDSFTFTDKEVVSLRWIDYDELKKGIENGSLHIVPHGAKYFGSLYEALDKKQKGI